VFDSGLGGLSVLAEIRRVLPHEDIVFFGDNAYCPYGGRSDEWLRNRSLEIADFLFDRGAKAIVVACNTASAAGLEHLRARFTAPIVGLVPAVKPAVELTGTGTVGVLATPAALRGRLLADVIERFATPVGVRVVTTAPAGMVEAVERGELDTPATQEAVEAALAPMLEAGADCIVLGCTHYPFLNPVLRRVAGDGVRLIDSSGGVALQTRRVLDARHLLRDDDHTGRLTVYTSGDPDVVAPVVWRLLGEEVPVLHESQAPPPVSDNLPFLRPPL
jgi:glutamate racemase